jgi:hypothetical protein
VWLTGPGGPVSPRRLLGPHLLVLTGAPDGVAAAEAAAAELGVPLRAHPVGPHGLADPDGEWARRAGVGARGSVLVRPDGVVAWRTADDLDPADLVKTLRVVLHR